MKLITATLALSLLALPLQANEKCSVEALKPVGRTPNPWINLDNRFSPEHLRIGLQSNGYFMPRLRIRAKTAASVLEPASKPLNLANIKVSDPFDQQVRSLEFLLDSRLYADGVLVLQNDKVLSETYRNGLGAEQARLLLGATRPVLSLMGVMAIHQGKLQPARSVVHHVPELNQQAAMRKLSIRRLLEGNSQFQWSGAEINDWQLAGGWKSGKAGAGMRAWLKQPGRWEKEWIDGNSAPAEAFPEDDLLVWILNETHRASLAQIFCEGVLGSFRPEHPAYWLTDPKGTELSGGLALSLRDLARFGQLLIDARSTSIRTNIPPWFIETLTASASRGQAAQFGLEGLSKGSESRYGFIRLGGAPNRVAILGPYGNSLYLDFDRQLVVAIYASYPGKHSPAMLATLEQIWNGMSKEVQLSRGNP